VREPCVHYLGHNQTERSPRRVVFLDSETSWTTTDQGEHHTLRLWAARLIVRGGEPRHTLEEHWAAGRTGPELVQRLERWHRTSATLWVFAHNLVIELCTCRILQNLLAAGWELGDHALANDAPWARLSKGRRRITLVDSATWFPRSIEHLGMIVKVTKPELPAQNDDEATWLDRCRADVEIGSAALEQTLDWWDRERLGCWSVTGTATGWNSYRHRPAGDRVLIDPDPEARAFERRAIYAGRRDTWRVGQQPKGRFVLIDLERAHLTAALNFPLPRRRGRRREAMALDDWHLHESGWEPMLDVTLRTASPRYPWRHQDRVWHPVGTLRTILAGPELRDAMGRDEVLTIHGGHLYLLGMTMEPWARWLAAILDGSLPGTPPAARVWAKMCSHRVFGKWAARTSTALEPYWSGERTWKLERGTCHPDGARMSIFHLDEWAHPMVHDQEADDAFPVVLAWIQSHVRLALNRLINALDPARLISCNTDGILYRAAVDPDLTALARLTAPFVPRIKAVYHDVDVLGAAHQVLDGTLRLSGIPSRADPTGETSLAWTTWPRMRRQLQLGEPDGYVREHREVDLPSIPIPRWVLADNSTRPVMTYVDPVGVTRIYPFVPGVTATHTAPRVEDQHPVLAQLLADQAENPLLAAPAW
jgi:hypothetical protein